MGPHDSGLLAKAAQSALDHFMRAGMRKQYQDIRRADPVIHTALHFAEHLGFMSSFLTQFFILSFHALITAYDHNTHKIPRFYSLC